MINWQQLSLSSNTELERTSLNAMGEIVTLLYMRMFKYKIPQCLLIVLSVPATLFFN